MWNHRLDLGIEKYSGPFTLEEVEIVKTVFRIIHLMICIVGLSCVDEVYWSIMKGPNPISFKSCFISNNTMKFVTPALLLFLHQFLIYSCFYKYIPSMLKRIGLGLVFALATTLSDVVIFKYLRNILSYFRDLLYTNPIDIAWCCISTDFPSIFGVHNSTVSHTNER